MELLVKQLEALISPNEWVVTNLSNASALLMDAIDDLSWVGFYMMRAGELVLGPFQGKVACTHIKVGKGACGVCVQGDQTILIEDVTTFPGYIACDAEAKSEIVVPLHDEEGKVIAVLDVDSNSLGRFGDKEQELFEALGKVLEKSLWSEKADA